MVNTKVMLSAVLFALLMLVCAAALAEEGAVTTPPAGGDQQSTVYKKKTVYDFEDDTITGDLTRPDGEYIDARRKVKHQNLIRIREDFKEKVLGSVSRI